MKKLLLALGLISLLAAGCGKETPKTYSNVCQEGECYQLDINSTSQACVSGTRPNGSDMTICGTMTITQ